MLVQDTNKKVKLYLAVEIIAMFTLCFIMGAFDWMNWRFSFDKITTSSFWSNTIMNAICYSIALGLGIVFRLERLELTDVIYLNEINKYFQLLKCKLENFEFYISCIFNPNTKKIFYVRSIQKKIEKLDKHASDSQKLAYFEMSQNPDYKFPDAKTEKYCKRHVELERLKSEEYITASLQFLTVRYPHIDAHAFTNNFGIHSISLWQQYQINNETYKELPKKMVFKVVKCFMIAVVISLIAFDPNASELLKEAYGLFKVILKYVIRIAMTCVNLVIGIRTGKELFNEQYYIPINNRNRILSEYIQYCHDTNATPSYADKLMQDIDKKEELENRLREQIATVEKLKG